MGEIVVLQQLHHLFNAHSPLGRHQLGTLFGQWRVHADGHMAVALFEEAAQLVFHAHTAHRDALRAPRPSVVGCEYLRGAQHIVQIVHRFALPHKHDVGQLVHFGQRIHLIEDVGNRQIAFKSLLAGLAKEAVHLATHLTGDAQCGPVFVGYIDCLHKLHGCLTILPDSRGRHGEEILHRPVFRPLFVYGCGTTYGVVPGQFFAVGF